MSQQRVELMASGGVAGRYAEEETVCPEVLQACGTTVGKVNEELNEYDEEGKQELPADIVRAQNQQDDCSNSDGEQTATHELAEDYARRSQLLARALASFGAVCGLYAFVILLLDGHLRSSLGMVTLGNSIISFLFYFYYCGSTTISMTGSTMRRRASASADCSSGSDLAKFKQLFPRLRSTAIVFAVQLDVTTVYLALVYYKRPYADITHWLVLVPIYILFMLGRRAGVIASLAIIPQAIFISIFPWIASFSFAQEWIDYLGNTEIGIFELTSKAAQFHASPAGRALNSVCYAFCVGIVCSAYEDARCSALAFLQQANERLHEATRAKAQFLANVTHDLRTPLHGIMSMAHELQDMSHLEPRATEAINIITDSSEHLLSLVNDLLDVESLEAGKVKLERITFSLTKEIGKVVSLLSVLAQQKEIQFEKTLHIQHDLREGDPLRFRQILYNLLSNSIKFTPECGHVCVRVVESDCGRPDLLRIEVHDTGIGIEANHLKSLFQAYFQSSPDVRRKFGGSGLGLAICKGLCEAMGGDISCRSIPGEDTTFIINIGLPLSTLEHDFESDTTGEGGGGDGAANSAPCVPEGFRVLLVDDNSINRKVGERVLTKLGADVTVAGSGYECLQLVQEHHYDAILMDCQMPGIDGFETTRRIRALESAGKVLPRRGSLLLESGQTNGGEASGHDNGNSVSTNHPAPPASQQQPVPRWRIPVIALTASLSDDIRGRCAESMMDDFLAKPYRKEELLHVFSRCQAGARANP